MNTFILNTETVGLPVEQFLSKIKDGNLTVLDGAGNPIAYVLLPALREELIYAEAQLDLELHREEVREAAARRTGVTTQTMLNNAMRNDCS